MADLTVQDGALYFRDSTKPVDQGGLVRLRMVQGQTIIEGKPAWFLIVEENTAVAGDFSMLRQKLYLNQNWNPADTTPGVNPNGGQPYNNDSDLILNFQNTEIVSDNNLRQGGAVNGALDVGPVFVLSREAPTSFGSYLGSLYAYGRSAGATGVNIVYASMAARVLSNDFNNPDGEWMFNSPGPMSANAGNYPRFAIGKGFRSVNRPSLGEETVNVKLVGADVFTNEELMNDGETLPNVGDIVGYQGWPSGARVTRHFDLAISFGVCVNPWPLMIACAGKCLVNGAGSANGGAFISAIRNSDGSIGASIVGTADKNTVGMVRRNLGNGQCEIIVRPA